MLEPAFTFTIPSLHDNTPLDCRIYHANLQSSCAPNAKKAWSLRGAIIAHPYTSLGGSYDDCVVLSAVAEIAKLGIVVGTFNFRGAGSSKGKASWSAKPELSDYVSFVGFFVQYLDLLMPPTALESSPAFMENSANLSPIPSNQVTAPKSCEADRQTMTIILGGYSFGSLLASHLPSVDVILERYAKIVKGSTEAEIRLRAQTLSTRRNKEAHDHCLVERGRNLISHKSSASSSRSMGIVFGGEESEPGSRQASQDSKRSLEFIRRSMDRSRRKLDLRTHSNGGSAECEELLEAGKILEPQVYYLLISPLLPPISLFATMFSRFSNSSAEKEDLLSFKGHHHTSAAIDEQLVNHPTLAIYGDKDFFTSPKKLRRWAEGLAERTNSLFQFKEIRGAGHFWHEEGVDVQMRTSVREWLQDNISSHGGM
ncbi:hypothetical protein MMC07_002924 [Pseudocyphellaria aurata]|nr:hypothetical protein [Pseudocyphellaria aurata]